MSLFLAALMCVTSLVGLGTTAYAAEETDDVYLLSLIHIWTCWRRRRRRPAACSVSAVPAEENLSGE